MARSKKKIEVEVLDTDILVDDAVVDENEAVEGIDLDAMLMDDDSEAATILAMVEDEGFADVAPTVTEVSLAEIDDEAVLKSITDDIEEAEIAAAEIIAEAPVEVLVKVEKVKERVARGPRVTDRSEFYALAGMTEEDFNARIDSAAKKVKEKIENLADAVVGNRLSGYTIKALKFANKNDRTFTVKGLEKEYEEEYRFSTGTAKAQAQQMSALFSSLGLADKDGKTFKLRSTPLVDKLLSMAA